MKKKTNVLLVLSFLFIAMTYCNGKNAETDTDTSQNQSTGQGVTVDVTKILVRDFAGFGTQYNQNLYSNFSLTDGIMAANIGQLEAKVKTLNSQYVRIFFDSKAWTTDPNYSLNTADFLDSFVKTVKLAQDAGAKTINITFWHTATAADMPGFAAVLKDLIVNRGLTSVKEVTIQNEPNSTSMSVETYNACYLSLDQALNGLGIRNRIRFVGGDLVQTNQQTWLSYMATNMNNLLSGYSSHIYWDDNDAAKPYNRLAEVANIVKGLGVSLKPIYITEYGVRGGNKPGLPDPGNLSGTSVPISQTTVSAMQNALFQIQGLNLGFAGFIRWDCYKAKYDGGTQYFSCIGSGNDGYPLYPLYYMTYLFTHTCEPGWQVVSSVTGSINKSYIVAAAMNNSNVSEQTIYAINMYADRVDYSLKGLIPNKTYNIYSFNSDGTGILKKESSVTTSAAGEINGRAMPKSLLAITTLDFPLP